jgi:hypothetical protein
MTCENTVRARFPQELEIAMQGLAYWLGWQASQHAGRSLTEGAVVDEFARLLTGVFGQFGSMLVLREHPVHALLGEGGPSVGRPPACDIVIRPKEAGLLEWTYAIEFKLRGRSELNDIERMSGIRSKSDHKQHCFVIVAGEGANARYLTEDGYAPRGTFKTSDEGQYKVRRVCRAVPTATATPDSGYWVIAFESV